MEKNRVPEVLCNLRRLQTENRWIRRWRKFCCQNFAILRRLQTHPLNRRWRRIECQNFWHSILSQQRQKFQRFCHVEKASSQRLHKTSGTLFFSIAYSSGSPSEAFSRLHKTSGTLFFSIAYSSGSPSEAFSTLHKTSGTLFFSIAYSSGSPSEAFSTLHKTSGTLFFSIAYCGSPSEESTDCQNFWHSILLHRLFQRFSV